MDDIHRPGSSRPQPMTTTPPPRTRVATTIPVSVKPATEPVQHPVATNVATAATTATAPTVSQATTPEYTEVEFEPPQIPARKEPETQPQQELESKGQVTQAPTNQPRQKGHWGAVIVALILAIALIAGAGYAYWQNQQTTKDVVKTPVKTTPEKPASTPVTADDVQTSSDKIDQSIKETDAVTDASEADLSDTTLGL